MALALCKYITAPITVWSRRVLYITVNMYAVSVLGRDEGYTVKYNPLPEGVPEGEARGNS